MKISPRLKNRLAEALIAALTAFITALTTTSCMGHGPLFKTHPRPLPRGGEEVKGGRWMVDGEMLRL